MKLDNPNSSYEQSKLAIKTGLFRTNHPLLIAHAFCLKMEHFDWKAITDLSPSLDRPFKGLQKVYILELKSDHPNSSYGHSSLIPAPLAEVSMYPSFPLSFQADTHHTLGSKSNSLRRDWK